MSVAPPIRSLKTLRNSKRLKAYLTNKRIAEATKGVPPPHVKSKILDEFHHDPAKQLDLHTVILRIISLAQVLSEKRFYAYQVKLAYRICESTLLHDGEVITALFSRQSGKTETVAATITAIAIIVPVLAKQNPGDWRLNITDEQENYRGFVRGIRIGIYAPRQAQSEIMFERIRGYLKQDVSKQVLKELNLTMQENNGNSVKLSHGSRILCDTASEQAKIEGETHNLVVAEECQDIGDQKLKKSIHPMVSATMGTMVKIGTSKPQKCDFYDAIKSNERLEVMTGKKNHFFFPYQVCETYNSHYRKFIEKEMYRLGENSDEFLMSYRCKWIFERGMFITDAQLFNREVALIESHKDYYFSYQHKEGVKDTYPYMNVVAGIDWGSANDSTVITLIAVNWNEPFESGTFADHTGIHHYEYYKKHVIGWYEWIGDDYETQYHAILPLLKSIHGLRRVTLDSNSVGRPMLDRMKADFRGTDIEIDGNPFNNKTKSDGYKLLAQEFSGKRITFPAGTQSRGTIEYRKFVAQMLDLKKEYKNGLMCVAHPDEKNARDDFPDSLMLATQAASSPSRGFTPEIGANFLYSR